METAHLQELIELENSYWWHVAKQRVVTNVLQGVAAPGARIIEGGIGGGGNLLHWRDMGYRVAGLDLMTESILHAKSKGLNDVHQHDLQDEWPLEKGSARAVVLLDVLEHLPDPVLALRNAANTLSAAGQVIFTVPAYPSLYSDWDQRLGHYRRYTMGMIQQQATEAGLYMKTVRHWNAFSLPAALAMRKYRKWKKLDAPAEFPRVQPWLNKTLLGLAKVEQIVATRFGLPCGLSLVGVLQK
jgi:2-polyprenyl-3-methyl-5-hydroxy-6-metoxy-1,4-benzoquinol methylase